MNTENKSTHEFMYFHVQQCNLQNILLSAYGSYVLMEQFKISCMLHMF